MNCVRASSSERAPGWAIRGDHRRRAPASRKPFTLYSDWDFRFKTLSDGRRQILDFLLSGDFAGLQDEFADGWTHGVEAVTGVTLCVFPRNKLRDLFHAQSRLGYDVT
jgi:CRP/FNR family transcriptional regulator